MISIKDGRRFIYYLFYIAFCAQSVRYRSAWHKGRGPVSPRSKAGCVHGPDLKVALLNYNVPHKISLSLISRLLTARYNSLFLTKGP